MKFSSVASLAALSTAVLAADQADVNFLTALVGDYDDNKKEYLKFIQTAKDVPAVLTKLALKVVTYTDDSYTTLLDGTDIDVTSLMSYATELPWYSRLESEIEAGVTLTEAATLTEVLAEADALGLTLIDQLSAIANILGMISSAVQNGSLDFSITDLAATSETEATSGASSSTASGSSSKAAGASLLAPVGAVMGAAALLLL